MWSIAKSIFAFGVADSSKEKEQEDEAQVLQTRLKGLLSDFELLVEYEQLQTLAPEGVYVMPGLDSSRHWHGVIFVHKGFYRGGVFRFRIALPMEYPNVPPSVNFLSRVFHPLVDPADGRVDIAMLLGRHWEPGKDFATHLLPALKKMLLRREFFEPDQPLNPEAKEVFSMQEDNNYFHLRATQCAEASASSLYDPGFARDSPIRFSDAAEEEYSDILQGLDVAASAPEADEEQKKTMFMEWFVDHYLQTRYGGKDDPDDVTSTGELKSAQVERGSSPKAALFKPPPRSLAFAAQHALDKSRVDSPGGEPTNAKASSSTARPPPRSAAFAAQHNLDKERLTLVCTEPDHGRPTPPPRSMVFSAQHALDKARVLESTSEARTEEEPEAVPDVHSHHLHVPSSDQAQARKEAARARKEKQAARKHRSDAPAEVVEERSGVPEDLAALGAFQIGDFGEAEEDPRGHCPDNTTGTPGIPPDGARSRKEAARARKEKMAAKRQLHAGAEAAPLQPTGGETQDLAALGAFGAEEFDDAPPEF